MRTLSEAWSRQWQFTLLAKCLILMTCEVLANALLWILSAILFTRHGADRQILSLALVAWTTGLRHGLDADHISAIDNATRRIVSVPRIRQTADGPEATARRPVTVGLFFSLGHSTIVFAVTVAIAISADVARRLGGVGDVGGIIGATVSGSFLVLIGCINTVILWRTWRRLRRANKQSERAGTSNGNEQIEGPATSADRRSHFNGCMTRLALPLLKMVDRPWKMYPVGVLFGLGFDTASSIALLSVTAIAIQNGGSDSSTNSDSKVVLLALLFTAGMTMVDSADSCLMIWAYAPEINGKGRKRLAFTRPKGARALRDDLADVVLDFQDPTIGATENSAHTIGPIRPTVPRRLSAEQKLSATAVGTEARSEPADTAHIATRLDAPASQFSLVLTLLSIVVAFAIGAIVLLGLIGDQCTRCAAAADKEENGEDGGLEGRWWLTWRHANDNSGYVGAGIVGVFVACVLLWVVGTWLWKRFEAQKEIEERNT